MNDLKQQSKKLQIFYSFITNFDTLIATVKEMVLSGDAKDYTRAEGICEIVGELSYGADDIQAILSRINSQEFDQRLMPLYKDLEGRLEDKKDTIINEIAINNEILLVTLMTRDHQPANRSNQGNASESPIHKGEHQPIKQKAGIPIEGHDLSVLNAIASATLGQGVLVSDISKKFKAPKIREVINRLYHESSYYFEQAFSNTDIYIQSILLEIIKEDQEADQNNDHKNAAFKALEDLGVLATIDTSANKMTSKVSDHHAFDLFINVLSKNNNEYIINKLISDDIILRTLFDISTMANESNYGFRRMFINAKYPYDGILIEKYKKLKKFNESDFAKVIEDLKRDSEFTQAYSNYLKTEKTKILLAVLKEARDNLFEESLTQEMVSGIAYVLGEFVTCEKYNQDILTMDLMMQSLESICAYMIRKNGFDQYRIIDECISRFYCHRVSCALDSRQKSYQNLRGEETFGITELDLWYECNRICHEYGLSTSNKVYLWYDTFRVFEFEMGGMLRQIEKNVPVSDIKELPKGEFGLIASTTGSRGFEQYAFNLYGRMIRLFMIGDIHTKLYSVQTSLFKKTELPGLSANDDKLVRKVVLDYMTLYYLWTKDSDLFIYVYRKKCGALLKALTSIEAKYEAIKKYVNLDTNQWVLSIFAHKSKIKRMEKEFERIGAKGKDIHVQAHAKAFFELAERK